MFYLSNLSCQDTFCDAIFKEQRYDCDYNNYALFGFVVCGTDIPVNQLVRKVCEGDYYNFTNYIACLNIV